MRKSLFIYPDGQELIEGDKVLIDNKNVAYIKFIIKPNTSLAKAYNCGSTPAFLLKYEDGNQVLWSRSDFDILLLDRE